MGWRWTASLTVLSWIARVFSEISGDARVALTILGVPAQPRKQPRPDTVLTDSTPQSRRSTRHADRGGRFLLPGDAGDPGHRRWQPGSTLGPAASRAVRRLG